jgi:hypothetical protein
LVAFVSLVFAMGWTSPAQAQPFDQSAFDESGTEFRYALCGDIDVRIDFHDVWTLVARVTGRDGTLRYNVSHQASAIWTNLATGRAFTFVAHFAEREVRATDNGDGTITIFTNNPGSERMYGPDGQLLYVSSGVEKFYTVLDYNGTLLDPSDDVFLTDGSPSK